MSEVKEDVTSVTAETLVKKSRRGITNEVIATSKLKFHEKDAAPNRLFVAHLHDVRVMWSVNGEGKQFAGEKVPRLVFEFCSNTKDDSQMRHYTHSLFPVESNVDTIPGGKNEWMFNITMQFIKHILDVYYLKGRQLTNEEEDALTLPFEDYDENGDFVSLDIKEILDGYAKLFTNVANIMNGRFNLAEGETPKPYYRSENGSFIRCWIKLIRAKKVKGEWKNVSQNGELVFDPFVGTGLVELFVQGKEPAIISIDESKESITPKEIKRASIMPGAIPGGAVMAGGPSMIGSIPGGAYNEAGDSDMPF